MRNNQRTAFPNVTSEGALLPVDVLQRISEFDASIGGISAEDYHHDGEKLNEMINDAWLHVLRAWHTFQTLRARLPESDAGTTLTRERWLLPLFQELGYGRLFGMKALEADGKSYPISHGWQHLPIHLVSFRIDLDHLSRSGAGEARYSPYSLTQELLNRSGEHLWGMVSNGLRLRLLRKNVSLTRQAYVEFDLEAMMQGESYADFVLFWLLCHQSRVGSERASDCWLEKWSRLAHEQGIRALDQLRNGVEQAINALGEGFLAQPANGVLREKLQSGELKPQDYYRQVLRFVYRMIVLFVAEDRGVLLHPEADEQARARYAAYYSTARLRRLAVHRLGTRHTDLYSALRLVMEQLGSDTGCLALGLPALNGFLFSQRAIPDLVGCALANHELLEAVRRLAFTYDENTRMQRSVDYKNIGAEELGSIYESLLELHPELDIEAASFTLKTASGNERKTSGSYYTPTSLIDCLLDSALDPVLAEAAAKADPEKAILALKVCDPACGSGHFLIAAAHRIAKKLAAVRTGTEEPGPESRRAALRDVVGHCIYGVDINPMAVELCKVNLWMEAIEPGKPLSFLDAHIQCGNSLLGSTPALLSEGIPDSAFEPIEGDDRKVCSEYKKKNKAQRIGVRTLFDEEQKIWDPLSNLTSSRIQFENMSDNTVAEIHRKQEYYIQQLNFQDYLNGKLWADSWCAAFIWKKARENFPYPITEERFRRIQEDPHNLQPWMRDEIRHLAKQYQFFHWHLAFPDVFPMPSKGEAPENKQVGWSGGFDVVLGNPPYIFGEHHTQKMKMCLQTIFDLAKGQYDLYWLFIEQGLKMINSNGRLALVVPDALLARDETQKTREMLLQAGLEHIYSCGMVFKVNVSTIIFVVSNQSRSKEVIGKTLNDDIVSPMNICSKERFHLDPKHRFLIHISDDEARIFSRIENECQPLRNFVSISRGEEIGKKGVLEKGPIPILVGEDITRYFIEQPSRFLQAIRKDIALYRSPKIVMMKTGLRCIAGLDKSGCVTMQSVYNLHITSSKIEYEPLLALLNSRFVHCFVYKTFTSYKGLFPQLNQSTILEIPIPYGIYIEKCELTNLVQEIQNLNEDLKIPKSSRDRELVRAEISSVDIKINKLLYNIYGLSEKEIDIIQRNV